MTVKIQITGFEYALKMRELTPILRGAVVEQAARLEAEARANAPRDTGELAASIRVKPYQRSKRIFQARIVAGNYNAYYAKMVEYGGGQIGKQTAQAAGLSTRKVKYQSITGWYAPLSKKWSHYGDWLLRRRGMRLIRKGNMRYRVFSQGGVLLRDDAAYWPVRGKARPFLTPALLANRDEIERALEATANSILR